jgi:tetraacyldisaccharide 4'-kinase
VSAVLRLQAAWLERGLLAWVLLPLSGLYLLLTGLRRAAYKTGLRRTVRLPVPVLVVGNLIAGGAGKTPTTLALVGRLQRLGHRPGLVSRGYGRSAVDIQHVGPSSTAAQVGDEPLLLHRRSGVPVAVGADRVAAALELLSRNPDVTVVVSDDGLQHWRLARDAQVIVFDERGTGNGWVLPAGPLRERLAPTAPPRTLVLYNAPSPSTAWPGTVARRRLGRIVALADWRTNKGHDATAELRGRPLLATAGTARPQRFFDMLRAAKLDITELPLPDHHDFTTLPWPPQTADVILTEKDAVKLDDAKVGSTRVWVARLDFEVDDAVVEQLSQWLPPPALST